MLYIIQYENKNSKELNKIYYLRNYIAPKLISLNNIIVYTQNNNITSDFSLIYDILFKSQDSFEVLNLYLSDKIKFKVAFRLMLRFYLKKILLNKKIFVFFEIDENEFLVSSILEYYYKYDKLNNLFKSQYKFVQSVILEYIIYLYDEYFFTDIINEDYEMYKKLKSNSLSIDENQHRKANILFTNKNIGSPHNYFQNTRLSKLLQIENYSVKYEIELCTQYVKMVYDSTKVSEDSPNPHNTSRFFKLLEERLMRFEGYSTIDKEVVISPDKLLANILEKIEKCSTNNEGKSPCFYNLIQDFKRFSINFQTVGDIFNWTNYLSKPDLFGIYLTKEILLEDKIANLYGGYDIFNYKVHVKSVKNSFAYQKADKENKNLKIIFEVMIIETGLVFQVELNCDLKSFADWKATDEIFYDITRYENKFYQIKNEYYEFLWYESNDRYSLIIILNMVWIIAFILSFRTFFLLDSYYEKNDTKNIDIVKNLAIKHYNLGMYEESLKYFLKIEKMDYKSIYSLSDYDLLIHCKTLIRNRLYDRANIELQYLIKYGNEEMRVEYYIIFAQSYYELTHDHNYSIKLLKNAIIIDSKNLDAYKNLAEIYYYNKNYEESINTLKILIELDPYNELAIDLLVSSYGGRNDFNHENENEFLFIQEIIKIAIHINPRIVSFYINLGRLYFVSNKYKDAIENFMIALDIDPGNGYTFNSIMNLFNQNDENESFIYKLDFFKKAIKYYEYKDAYFIMGKKRYDHDKIDDALKWLYYSIEYDPNNIQAYLYICKAYLKKDSIDKTSLQYFNNIDKAIYYFNLAIDKKPSSNGYFDFYSYFAKSILKEYSTIYYGIGYAYYQKDKYNLATKWLKETIEFDKNYLYAYNLLIEIYFIQENYEDTLYYFQIASGINSHLLTKILEGSGNYGYYYIGISYLAQLNNDLAIKYLEKAIEIDRNNLRAYVYLGNAYLSRNSIDSAISKYQYYLFFLSHHDDNEIYPVELEVVYLNLGRAYELKYNLEESIFWYKKCLNLNNRNVNPYLRMAELYLSQNMKDEAIKVLNKIISIDPRNEELLKLKEKYFMNVNSILSDHYDIYHNINLKGII